MDGHSAVFVRERVDAAGQPMRVECLARECAELRKQVDAMQARIQRGEQRRTGLLHLITDFNEANKRLANQRKAMLHILDDYERDRRRLVQQAERLDNSRA